jgi:hypothetical protein
MINLRSVTALLSMFMILACEKKAEEVAPIFDDKVNAPAFSIEPGTYSNDITVALAMATEGAQILYTLDGTEPTDLSKYTVYRAPINSEGGNLNIIAKAMKPGFGISETVKGLYELTLQEMAALQFSTGNGTQDSDFAVSVTTSTPDVQLFYGLQSDPLQAFQYRADISYTGPVSIAGDLTHVRLTLRSVKSGFKTVVDSREYEIAYPVAASPTANVAPGVYNTDLAVSLNSVAGQQYYYTVDGSEPSEHNGQVYTGSIPVGGDGTTHFIKVIAIEDKKRNSRVSKFFYQIDYNYVEGAHDAGLTLANAKQKIVGTWIGSADFSPTFDNTIPFNVRITFGASSHTSEPLSPSSLDGKWVTAFYGGNEGDNVTTSKAYSITSVDGNGMGLGTISFVQNSMTPSQLKNIAFSNDGRYLMFEFQLKQFGSTIYTPAIYKLVRQP